VRDTADKLAIARKLLKDIDKAKPEVVDSSRSAFGEHRTAWRDLGILPGQSAVNKLSNAWARRTTHERRPRAAPPLPLPTQFRSKGFHFGAADYNVTLPGAHGLTSF